MATVSDATGHILNHLVVQELRELSFTLLVHSPYPIVILNKDTSIKYVNTAFENITGYSSQELIGQKAPYVWWVEKSTLNRTKRLKISMRKDKYKFERLFKRKTGELFWVEITSQSIKENNVIKYHFSIWIDITERKKAQYELTKLNAELRNLSAYAESASEKEREKIGRGIHDELGQVLTAIQLEVDLLSNKLTKKQKDLLVKTQTITNIIDGAITSVHRICSALTPKLLDDVGIEAAIECLTSEFLEPAGIECELSCSPISNYLNRNLAIFIYRIIQHAITNIVRHAHATKVWVTIRNISNYVYIEVKDNGIGIKREQVLSPNSHGIMIMRERVNYWKGNIKITGIKNKGTKIAIKIPISKPGNSGNVNKDLITGDFPRNELLDKTAIFQKSA